MDIFIYGVVGEPPYTSEGIQQDLSAHQDGEPITIHINSPGGDVYEGYGIYNQLRALSSPITTRIDGMCGSIATLIALAADSVQISEAGSFMIHNAWTMIAGDQNELKKHAELLENISNTIKNVYANKTNISTEALTAMMDDEVIMSSQEALDLGFVDEIVNPIKAVAYIKNNTAMKFTDHMKKLYSQIIDDPKDGNGNGDDNGNGQDADNGNGDGNGDDAAAEPKDLNPDDGPKNQDPDGDGPKDQELTQEMFDEFAMRTMQMLEAILERLNGVEETTEEEMQARQETQDQVEELTTQMSLITGKASTKGKPPKANGALNKKKNLPSGKPDFSNIRKKTQEIDKKVRENKFQ